MQRGYFRMRDNFYIPSCENAVHEVLRKRVFQTRSANDHRYLGSVAREVHHGLSGGIAAADHIDVLVSAAQRRFARAGAVVHTDSKKTVLVRKIQTPVRNTRSADARVRDNLCPILQIPRTFPRLKLAAHSLAAT